MKKELACLVMGFAAWAADPRLTARQVIERIEKSVGVPWTPSASPLRTSASILDVTACDSRTLVKRPLSKLKISRVLAQLAVRQGALMVKEHHLHVPEPFHFDRIPICRA